jgi:O-antigen/teichoic acid export membrane protein
MPRAEETASPVSVIIEAFRKIWLGIAHALKSGSAVATASEGVRVALQAGLLVLLGRALGVDSFGRFVSTLAFLQFVQPLAWRGAWIIPIQLVKLGNATVAEAGSRAIATVIVGGSLASVGMLLAGRPILLGHVSFAEVGYLSLAELVFAGVTETLAYLCLAERRFRDLLALRTVAGALRLGALALLMISGVRLTDVSWSLIYLILSVCVAFGFWLFLRPRMGLRASLQQLSREELRSSMAYAISGVAAFAQDNLDKPMVLRLASAPEAGLYGAGYRVISLALVPTRGLMQAAYPRFFELGRGGVEPAMRYANRLLPFALGYGLFVGAVMWLVAPIMGLVFGAGFEQADAVVRWLAVVPAIRAFSYMGGDALTGAGLQKERARFIVVTSLLNIGLNLILIPRMGWRGAAVATIAADGALAVLTYGYGLILAHQSQRKIQEIQYDTRST